MKTFAAFLAFRGLACLTFAQSVEQCDPNTPSADATQFHSPMVLETIFPISDLSAWRKITSMEGFTNGKPLGLGAWPARLGRETSIPAWYELGRDTCDGVTIAVDILDAEGKILASGSRVQKTPANSKSGNNADVVFLLSSEEMGRAAKLRLTMSAKDY